ncbi:MAG: SAM-dependent methyltransferase [Variovorax sp.]|nr:SAM-dependent methyltransferase [Variovorax sp.]
MSSSEVVREVEPGRRVERLAHLARLLEQSGYRFTTVTPETHRRVVGRADMQCATSLRDVFGWNLPFERSCVDAAVWGAMREADVLASEGALFRSTVRFATLDDLVYLHSGFPTLDSDAVFFGPDTYRFVALIERTLTDGAGRGVRVLDVGCGGGAGGLVAARWLRRTGFDEPRVELVDINPRALDYARVNVVSAGASRVEFRLADLYADTKAPLDLIVANPPYLLDRGQRLYRHGGGRFGSALSERIVAEGLPLLAPGGALVLYTGAPMVRGRDPFHEAVRPLVDIERYSFDYRELDPDVFGEELDDPAYRDVERIAVVGLVVRRRTAGEGRSP